MQIYNPDAMTDLILAHASGRYSRKYSYLIKDGVNADTAADVLRVMRESHEPLSFDDMHRTLWYIPLDTIKHTVSMQPSIVRAEQGKFYYAPNLPISAAELDRIARMVQNELTDRSYISGKELVDMVISRCPDVAMNIGTLTPLCVRNSLGYLMRDKFSFSSAIVSAQGSEINMADVYADFARERESFTLDELKDLSAELNVSIYWDAVMGQVVAA